MMSKTQAAYEILNEVKKPMHVKEIIAIALERNMIKTDGKTPEATLSTDLLLENRRKSQKGQKQRFSKVGPGTWKAVN